MATTEYYCAIAPAALRAAREREDAEHRRRQELALAACRKLAVDAIVCDYACRGQLVCEVDCRDWDDRCKAQIGSELAARCPTAFRDAAHDEITVAQIDKCRYLTVTVSDK